ncbi:endonuclease III domain-containing protein [bacterium]|nr:endonuclease III domain-containing protein [bacterium]
MSIHYRIEDVFQRLMEHYGPQGWWPIVLTEDGKSTRRSAGGYHAGDYTYPHNDIQRLEICLGAILTQNTNWNNVVTALKNLKSSGSFSFAKLVTIEENDLARQIKSAGYYNQKAGYIKNFIRYLKQNPFSHEKHQETSILRKNLLQIRGLGPETVDCILLYAFNRYSFVVDAYTQRILGKLRIIENNTKYEFVKERFESSLPKDLFIYQEYHALLVEHGKRYYSRKPYGEGDPLF